MTTARPGTAGAPLTFIWRIDASSARYGKDSTMSDPRDLKDLTPAEIDALFEATIAEWRAVYREQTDYPLLDFDAELTPEDHQHIEDLIALHGVDPEGGVTLEEYRAANPPPAPLPEPPVDPEDTRPLPTGGAI